MILIFIEYLTQKINHYEKGIFINCFKFLSIN